jgi:malonyl-CoA O-methyltransferase
MLSFKEKIESNFDRHSPTYDEVAHVQRLSAKVLIKLLRDFFPDFIPTKILDVGAGTGAVTEILFNIFSDSLFCVNDIASGMLSQVKSKKIQNTKFLQGDFETLDFEEHDLIVSNFALQWANDLGLTVKRLFSRTSVLAVTCLEDGSFAEWHRLLRGYGVELPSSTYPSREKLDYQFRSLQGRIYHTQSKEFQISFTSVVEFLDYLKLLGASASNIRIPLKTLKSIIENQKEVFSITYKVFFVVVGK